jgi:hypothetical protein
MSSVRNTLILTASLLASHTANSAVECMGRYDAQLNLDLPIPYFLNTPLTKVYTTSTGDQTKLVTYQQGKLLFAVDDPKEQTPNKTRLWMGEYDETEEASPN